jgi:hypothetical protein
MSKREGILDDLAGVDEYFAAKCDLLLTCFVKNIRVEPLQIQAF